MFFKPAKELLYGDCFDSRWRMAAAIMPVSKSDVDWMIRKHYLHKWPGVVVLRLGLYCFDWLCGCCIFALPPRETSKRYGGLTWELARLWLDDVVPRNGETFLIGRSVRYVRANFADVKYLVSYADPSVGHTGLIYKAANWVSDGRTDQERKTPRFDYMDANSGKVYSRRAHVPAGVVIKRRPRVSKPRFIYSLER